MKKTKKLFFYTIGIILLFTMEVYADSVTYMSCGNYKGIPYDLPGFIRAIITIIQIAVPIILILIGSIDFLKVVLGSKNDDLNNATKKFVLRLIAASSIFFLFLVVKLLISLIGSNDDGLLECLSCFTSDGNECSTYEVEKADYSDEKAEADAKRKELEEKREEQRKENEKKKEEELEKNSGEKHKSSITGITYNLYNQMDPRWSNIQTGGGDNIGQIGCMVTAVAVVSSSVNTSITPATVVEQKLGTSHPYTSIPKLTNGKYNCTMKRPSSSFTNQSIIDALYDGKVVIVKVWGKNRGGRSPFSPAQHYMAIIDVKSENNTTQFFIGNSYSLNKAAKYAQTGWFNASEVLTSYQTAEVCTPA